MKLTALSDTHGRHHDVIINEGDIIIHAGDFLAKSNQGLLTDFCSWYGSLNFRHKILISGNHDRYRLRKPGEFDMVMREYGIIYLENNSIKLLGYNFYGSPYTKKFGAGGAFDYERSNEAKKIWDLIPADTDILITHGPPYGFCDDMKGCRELSKRVLRLRPLYHIFGHIHSACGIDVNETTTYINACLTDEEWNIVNKPVEIFLPDSF